MGGGQKYKSTYARCINNVCPNFFSTKIVRESTARGRLNFLFNFRMVKTKKGKAVNLYGSPLFQGLPLRCMLFNKYPVSRGTVLRYTKVTELADSIHPSKIKVF